MNVFNVLYSGPSHQNIGLLKQQRGLVLAMTGYLNMHVFGNVCGLISSDKDGAVIDLSSNICCCSSEQMWRFIAGRLIFFTVHDLQFQTPLRD